MKQGSEIWLGLGSCCLTWALAFASVRPGEAAVPRDVEQMLVASKWGKNGDNGEAFYLAQRAWDDEVFYHEF